VPVDALLPPATVRVSPGTEAPTVTDGPFAEGAGDRGGYYVFEAENWTTPWLWRAISPRQTRCDRGSPIFHTMDSSGRVPTPRGWRCC